MIRWPLTFLSSCRTRRRCQSCLSRSTVTSFQATGSSSLIHVHRLSYQHWETIFEDILGNIKTRRLGLYNPQEPRLPVEEESAAIIHELARQVSNTSSFGSDYSISTVRRHSVYHSSLSSLSPNLIQKLGSLLFNPAIQIDTHQDLLAYLSPTSTYTGLVPPQIIWVVR